MNAWFRLLAITLALASSLGHEAAAQRTVLRIVPHADLALLDPVTGTPLISRQHALLVYETLFALDSRLVPQPMMVDRHTVSPDRRSHMFTLRDGLRFHDGQPVTARDVAASLRRWMARDPVGARLNQALDAIEVADPRTLTMRFRHAIGFVEYSLSNPVIMREREAMVDPFTPITEVVGSGPFRFVAAERRAGDRFVYERNPDYVPRREPPDGLAGARNVYVDRLEFRVIGDANTAAAALAAGEIDFWDTPSLDLMRVLDRNPNIVVRQTVPAQNVALVRPNHLHPPFNDVRARQALALLMDQRDALAAAAGDEKWWRSCGSYFVCGTPFGTEAGSEPYRTTNVERARQLLAEAGYRGEPVLLMGTPQLPIIGALAQVVADRLRAGGVNVDLRMMDWANVVQRFNNRNAPDAGGWNLFTVFGTGPAWSHPLTNFGTNTRCDGRNFAGWPCDEQAAQLLDRFLNAVEGAERDAALASLHRRLWQVIPYVPLGQFDQPHAWRRNLDGVLQSAILVFWNIRKN